MTIEKIRTSKPFLERYYEQSRKEKVQKLSGALALQESMELERRFDDEVISGFSEALLGIVRAEYTFDVRDEQIIAVDGECLSNMMYRARNMAYEIAQEDPEMAFVPPRFEAEIGELNLQHRLIDGTINGNTIVTFSPMTMELQNRPDLLSKGFQRPDVRRSMLRISHWDGSQMHIFTRSLDNSNLDALKDTAKSTFGHDFGNVDSLEMLQNHIVRTFTIDQIRELLDSACRNYESILRDQSGTVTVQGALRGYDADLLQFVYSHPDILKNIRTVVNRLTKNSTNYAEFEAAFRRCLYSHLSLYQELLEGKVYDTNDVNGSVMGAGERAADNNVSYSLCGTVISSSSREQPSAQTSFENLSMYDRLSIVSTLTSERRQGHCLVHGTFSTVYGCGLCKLCHKIWSDEYIKSGKGLEIDAIAKRAKIKLLPAKNGEKLKNKTSQGVKKKRVAHAPGGWLFFRR